MTSEPTYFSMIIGKLDINPLFVNLETDDTTVVDVIITRDQTGR